MKQGPFWDLCTPDLADFFKTYLSYRKDKQLRCELGGSIFYINIRISRFDEMMDVKDKGFM